jgi:hypothetical protein
MADGPAEEESSLYTDADLGELKTDELKELLTDVFHADLPKPPIRTRLITAILKAQAAAQEVEPATDEPPF